MQMISCINQLLRFRGQCNCAARTMPNIEDEIALTIGAVAHESASGCRRRMNPDCRHINTITTQTLNIEFSEIITTNSADYSAWLPQFRDLINKDRWRTGRKRTDQRNSTHEAIALFESHNFHHDLADGNDFLHIGTIQIRK